MDSTPIRPRGVGGDYRKRNHRAAVIDSEMAGSYYEVSVKDFFKHLNLPEDFEHLSDQDVLDVGGFGAVVVDQKEEQVYEPMVSRSCLHQLVEFLNHTTSSATHSIVCYS